MASSEINDSGAGFTAQVIGDVITERLREGAHGVLLSSLPKFDSQELANRLAVEYQRHAFYLCVLSNPALRSAAPGAGFSADDVIATPERTVLLRSNGSKPLVVFAAPHMRKITSLERFARVTASDLFDAACESALAAARNGPQRAFWGAMRDLAEPVPLVPLSGLLDCASAVAADGQVDELYGRLLHLMGLMTDAAVIADQRSQADISRRILLNLQLVKHVEQLTARQLADLRALAPVDGVRDQAATVRSLVKYAKHRKRVDLADVEYDDADRLLARLRRGIRTSSGGNRAIADPIDAIVPLLAEGRTDELRALGEQIGAILDVGDEDMEERVENPITHEPYTRVARFQRFWPWVELAETDESWGGVVVTTSSSTVEALATLSPEMFRPLRLDHPEGLLPLLEQQVQMGILEQSVLDSLRMARDHRNGLLPHLRQLIEQPTLTLASDEAARRNAAGLVNAFQAILATLKANFEAMAGRGIQSAESVIAQLLALDLLLVHHPDGRASAIALPLNVVELWKHLQLATEMIKALPGLELDEQETLQGELHNLPALLDVVTLPNLATGQGVHTLSYTGKLGPLPYYEEIHRRFRETEGVDEIVGICERLLNVYPHAAEGLRIALIEPPSALQAIASLRKLLGRSGGVSRLYVTIFRVSADAADPASILSDDEEESLGEEVFTGSRRRLFVEFQDLSHPMAYREVAQALTTRPQHLAMVFDPSTLKDQRYPKSDGPEVHPLSVPMTFEYDEGMDRLSLVPEPTGPLFSDRTELEAKLGHHLRNTFPALVADYPSQMEALEDVAKNALWLGIADFATDSPTTLGLPLIGVHRAGRRELSFYTQHLDKFESAFAEQLRQSNLDPQPDRLSLALREMTRFLNDGMLAVLARRAGSPTLQPRLIGAIGVLVVVDRLRREHPGAVIVSIDSPIARRWLKVEQSDKRADLVALIDHESSIELRIVEVKTHEGQQTDFAVTDGVASGRAIEQLERTAQVCEAIVGQGLSDILTPARREVLRTQMFGALKTEAKPDRLRWWSRINDLLAQRLSGHVTLTVATVQLGAAKTVAGATARTASGRVLNIQNLTQPDIRAYFDGRSPGAPPTVPLEPRPGGPSAGTDSAPERPDPSPHDSDALEPTTEPANAQPDDVPERLVVEAADLKRILAGYDIPVVSVDPALAQVGPSVIRYRIKLRANAKIKTLQSRAEDIQREVSAIRVPLIDNLAGEPYAYIDLRRPDPQIVGLPRALERLPEPSVPDLLVPVGVTPGGVQRNLDLAEAPHLLVSGTTKSGKTMFLYSLIVSLARRNPAQRLQMLLVDPKATDFVYFDGLPHLHGSAVITDAHQAVAAITQIVEPEGDMEIRTRQLRMGRDRDIHDYNRRHPDAQMRPLVIVIDEFADLVMVLGRQRGDFDAGVNRLAQRGRSVGIHLVIATQRPSVEFVTGALKANMPARISFRLPSQTDSRVILDRNGAESLLGNGDMLLFESGEVERLQGFFVASEEIDGLLS